MAVQIHFFSPAGYMPMKDKKLKSLIGGSHGWQDTGETWVFGVCEAKVGVHPAEIRDYLTTLGVIHLPSVNDSETLIDPKIYAALSPKYITSADRTRAIATKMGKFHPLLRVAE